MSDVRSCGVLVMRRQPELSFLLMRHIDRWDLPKGHVDPGETDLECALRELQEETGIAAADLQLDDRFLFQLDYPVRDRRDPQRMVEKTLCIFLGWLQRDVSIQLTEHLGFEWFPWRPPHRIQAMTIDPLLAAVERHLVH
jgi:bis(5'-nucleosidyl)-tetraphosphatase